MARPFSPGIVKPSSYLKGLWARKPGSPSSSLTTQVKVGEIPVLWCRSARRRKTLALKLDREGRVVAMTPVETPLSELERFVRAREQWIIQHLAQFGQQEAARQEARGNYIWLMGERLDVECCVAGKNAAEAGSKKIVIYSRQALDTPGLERRLNKWLRQRAGDFLPERAAGLAETTGLQAGGIQVRHYSARWGSCRHDGSIQLNWKLIQTPPEVIDYVIIHELSHLAHFNHSPAFWRLVGQHCPKYKIHRRWLKENGRLLLAN